MTSLVRRWGCAWGRRWDRHWFAPASLRELAAARILIVAGMLVVFPAFTELTTAHALASSPATAFIPLPALKLLLLPFGWGVRPSAAVLTVAWYGALAAGGFALIGCFTRTSLALFAYATTMVVAHEYSYDEVHHAEALMAIVLFALALAPSGAALSVDALRRRLRAARTRQAFTADEPAADLSPLARWPLRLGQWLLALAYLSAGISKLHTGGLAWMNGVTLSYYFAYDGLGFGRPLGIWLSQHALLAQGLSIGALLFELTFWVAVLRPRVAWLYVLAGTGMHLGIYLTQRAPFFQFIVLYVVFLGPLRASARSGLAYVRRRFARTAPAGRWTVIYDGRCPLCIRTATVLDVLDGGRRLAYVDFESDWAAAAAAAPTLTPERAREAMHLIAPDGRVLRGFHAFRAMTDTVPALWPFSPLMHAPLAEAAGTRAYARVAAHRARRPCDAATCTI